MFLLFLLFLFRHVGGFFCKSCLYFEIIFFSNFIMFVGRHRLGMLVRRAWVRRAWVRSVRVAWVQPTRLLAHPLSLSPCLAPEAKVFLRHLLGLSVGGRWTGEEGEGWGRRGSEGGVHKGCWGWCGLRGSNKGGSPRLRVAPIDYCDVEVRAKFRRLLARLNVNRKPQLKR